MTESPNGSEITILDEIDKSDKLPVVPSSVNSGKMVKLGVKTLKTVKEVRVVLPEEEYLGKLQDIIVRDYFPELPKLKAQKEYLDALASNDLTKVRELQLRYSMKRTTDRRTSPMTARRTPKVFDADEEEFDEHGDELDGETPGPAGAQQSRPETITDSQRSDLCNRMGDNEVSRKKKKNDEDALTIDSYLNKFTSEDNASFDELTEMNARKERLRNAWMYEAEEKHNQKMVTRGTNEPLKAADEQLMIAIAPGASEARPKELDNWTYQARNAVLFDIEEKPLTMQEHFERQKMNQRQINKQATRFTEDAYPHSRPNSMQRASILSSSNQPGKVDISGQEINQGKHGDFDLVVTPSPAPGVDDSPFMTWGEIEGTPFRLDASDMPMTGADGNAPTFKIPEVPIREKIAQEMTETIAKRYRDKRKAAIRQIEKHARTPRFGSTHSTDRLLSMSPAAMRLATKGLGIRLNSDKALKASYTPSPTRTPSTPLSTLHTPSSSLVLRKAPSTSRRDVQSSSPLITDNSITDNLLNFAVTSTTQQQKQSSEPETEGKSRPSAVDFF